MKIVVSIKKIEYGSTFVFSLEGHKNNSIAFSIGE